MILTELELQNFGVYAGRHSIALDPPEASKPIILFGGLNGAGKTTILEAVQLALYGKRTQTAKREGLSYDDYLRRWIHHSVPHSEGAAVSLRFRIRTQGELKTIRISRNWRETKSRIREVEEVHVGPPGEERLDTFLTDRWAEYIDEIVPIGVAPLFFFDADRIEGFADLANSGELIRTAVHGLLGLDLVDRLALDLQVLERRKLTSVKGNGHTEALRAAEGVVTTAETVRETARERVRTLEDRRDDATERLAEVEERFRKEGGELFNERGALEAQLQHSSDSAAAVEEELRALAAGAAPLLLVLELIEEVRDEDEIDQTREASTLLQNVLEERDQALTDFLRTRAPGESRLVDQVVTFLESERNQRTKGAEGEPVFSLSRDTRYELQRLLQGGFDELRVSVSTLLNEFAEVAEGRDHVERKLQGVPEEDAISSLIRERGDLRSSVAEAEANLLRAREEKGRLDREVEAAERTRATAQKKAADQEWSDEAAQRTVKFSERSRCLLAEFRTRILDRNIRRIEQLVLESFRQLLRKEGLVRNLEIDPETLALRLYGPEGQVLHPDRLSAGERQLLAISLLWGLARASQRTLPTIVDTPLGRLDSVHREHLVTRYFPYAGHQVLLLSTDEEIGEGHLERLSEHIGRSYRLDFDDALGRTEVVEGYFVTEAVT